MSYVDELNKRIKDISGGGPSKYHESNEAKSKLFVRERINLLFDEGINVEDAFFTNCIYDELHLYGVVTGIGKINGEKVCVMTNDYTVKAGSWGARTFEKIVRIQETALKLEIPMLYLVDSAGARITDQVDMLPNRRGAGRIFNNQIKMSVHVRQECLF